MTRIDGLLVEPVDGDVVLLDEETGDEVLVPASALSRVIGALEYFAADEFDPTVAALIEANRTLRALMELCEEADGEDGTITIAQVRDVLAGQG
jgi:hypothetical protein